MSWLLLNGLDGVTLGYQRDHQVIDPHQPQPPLGHDLSANELTRSRGTPPRPGRPQGAFSSWPAAVAGVAVSRLAHRPDGTVILFGGVAVSTPTGSDPYFVMVSAPSRSGL
jgi:hypothetical protein